MFTQQELISEFPRQLALPPVAIDVFAFAKTDFAPEIGHYLWVFEGKKCVYETALAFWIEATIALRDDDGPFDSGLMNCLCEPINQKQFEEIAGRCTRALTEPLPSLFHNLDGFCWGMRMHNEWADHSAMAELADSFVAFFATVRTSDSLKRSFPMNDG